MEHVKNLIDEDVYNKPRRVLEKKKTVINLDHLVDEEEDGLESDSKLSQSRSVTSSEIRHYMPSTFGAMMNYISYKEQREKILKDIHQEKDINLKYTQFSKLVKLNIT